MGERVRVVAVVVVIAAVGALVGSAATQWMEPGGPRDAAGRPDASLALEERVRVQVLNGGGVSGMARSATEHLRDAGFDVVDYGNADVFDRDSSVVVDRVGNLEWAGAVASTLGIEDVRSEPDADLLVDVTVVLGTLWVRPAVPGPTGDEAPWWDLRRLFEGPGDGSVEPAATSGGRLADPAGAGR